MNSDVFRTPEKYIEIDATHLVADHPDLQSLMVGGPGNGQMVTVPTDWHFFHIRSAGRNFFYHFIYWRMPMTDDFYIILQADAFDVPENVADMIRKNNIKPLDHDLAKAAGLL